jgi:putative endonuclease
MRHSVYVVRCADGTLYTGYSTDVGRRLREHNAGKGAKYTRGRAPVELVYLRDAGSKGAALRLEARIKKMSRRSKLLLCAGRMPVRGHGSR